MRTIGFIDVTDYEHQGDIDRTMCEVKEIDPSAFLTDTNIRKEDPDADCESCTLTISFDYSKVNDFRKEFAQFEWLDPQPEEAKEDTIVYVTKTGKSYKLKQDKKWSIAKTLSQALKDGMYLYASKKN